MTSFEPIHAAHAIDLVSADIRFNGEIDDAAWDRLKRSAAEMVEPSMTARGVPEQAPDDRTVVFASTAEDGSIVDGLRITPHDVSFATFQYTRWKQFAARAYPLLGELGGIIAEQAPLHSIGIAYIDRFVAASAETDMSALLEPTSPFVPGFTLTTVGPWQSEGAYQERVDAFGYRSHHHLMARNAGAAARDGFEVTIQTTITDVVEDAGDGVALVFTRSLMEERFEDQHRALKLYLAGIINSHMAERISLGAGEKGGQG